eukprot:Skav220554  [mRNA]  locus=scaffold761:228169:228702:+ [translate_table: standard]
MDKIIIAHRKEVAQAQKDVQKFLTENGFNPGKPNDKQEKPRSWFLKWFPKNFATYPIHEAVKQNNPYMVSLLIGLGANPKKRDGWGCTAFYFAKKRNHKAVMDVLYRFEALEARTSLSKTQGRMFGKLHTCPPPHGFEEFFAKVSEDPSVVQNMEVEWLQMLGPKTRVGAGTTEQAS